MRRSNVLLTTLALLIALLAPSQASAAPLGPKQDAVLGGGKTFSDILSINAHSLPNSKVLGHINVKNTADLGFNFSIEGTVTCLNIVGNRASVGGELTHFEQDGYPNPDQYHGWLMYVEDNGNQQGTLDKISYQYIYINPVTTCPNPAAGSAFFDLTEGNLIVTKAQ